MPRLPLEVADVASDLADARGEVPGLVTSAAQRRVLRALTACRTARLGAHIDRCQSCAHLAISYNSCRNRHCPKCQASSRVRWFEERRRDLLPASYFHVVFTLPRELAPLALQNKKTVYDILFRAASQTLLQIAAEPRRLGAKIGFIAVLHTWGQTLVHHPHLHCIVPGGGFSPDGKRWVTSRAGYFLPVKVLAAVFRGKFLDYLARAYSSGDLDFRGSLEELGQPRRFKSFVTELYDKSWVVYAKPPMAGPEQVLGYLARYTHRVAIANSRLVSLGDGQVRFRYKDYARGGRQRTLCLQATEFLRRFLLHVLPAHFVRIRHYGILAHRCRRKNLDRARRLIADTDPVGQHVAADDSGDHCQATVVRCPRCKTGVMVMIERLTAAQVLSRRPPLWLDSS